MSLPATMLAIAITAPGGPEVLQPERRPVPAPGPGELVIRVAAAGVNRPDLLQRSGAYPPPRGASDLPGLEVAGTVAACGDGATRFREGQAACALCPGGGYAEYVAVPEAATLPIPAGLSPVEAAAVPETFFTVWANVFGHGRLTAGETLLVHGGASGIGTVAVMLGKAFGARVLVTVGSEDKAQVCRRLGADGVINHRATDFVGAVKAMTDGEGAHVILDMVGGGYVSRNYQAAAESGRIVQIAFLEGARTTVDLTPLMLKRLVHTGSTLRPRTVAEKGAIARDLEAHVWPLLAKGAVRPLVARTFPLAEAAAAHRLLEAGGVAGKLVLTVGGGVAAEQAAGVQHAGPAADQP